MPPSTSQEGSPALSSAQDTTLTALAIGGDFDPVDYLNSILPAVSLSSQTTATKTNRAQQMQTVSSEVQSLLSRLNTQHIRSSTELTDLTDEILRSGNRLAYEVEILRGDVNSFYDLLTDTLKDDIQHFVRCDVAANGSNQSGETAQVTNGAEKQAAEPEFITQLQMLGKVKARLESVINIFGEAMKWPVPPSELSNANALISVSAPELGMQNTEEDDKARDAARHIKAEIQILLDSDGGGINELDAATRRVEVYTQLATVWKGTAEEKGRSRFVDSLIKLVDDRRKVLDSRALQRASTARSSSQPRPMRTETGGGGLFRNLARLKDDLYLE